ncbi:MAG: type II secretion system protein GspL [Steroidobacteraceae bacterium]
MLETLVIRLLTTPSGAAVAAQTPAQWLLVDAHGSRLGALLQGNLSEAAGLATGRRVIVLVPGADALHMEPVLPPVKGNTKLSQVVPYALEDQLATDVDALHFAVGKRGARPGTPVIVVSHDAMQRWIFALREVGLQIDALYTDTSMVPIASDGLSVLIDQGRVTSREQAGPVNTLDVTPLSEALLLLLPATTQPATMYVTDLEYDAQQTAIESVRERAPDLQIKLLSDGVLPLLALQAVQGAGINLLQGVYTPRSSMRNNLHPWRYAAILLVAFFGAHLLTKGIELWQLRKQEASLDQQLRTTYNQGLPGAASVDAAQARKAFETRLLQLQGSNGANGLMSSLNVLSHAMSNSAELQLEAVSFRNDNVDVRILAPTVDSLEQIRQQAQAQGIAAEIQAANPKNNKIEGRLQLKSPPGA